MQVVRIRQTTEFHSGGAIHCPGLEGLNKPIVWVFSGAVPLFELRKGGIYCPR
jgi:hypothetical protein